MAKNKSFLLDTQVFIWWMGKSRRLSKDLINLLHNPQNQIFLSVASVWEIIIKRAKHKLRVPNNIEKGINLSGFTILPIEISHVLGVEKLPLYHKDPFDRMLISQAVVEKLMIITNDEKIKKYPVKVF